MNDYPQFKLDLGQRLDQLHEAVEHLAQDRFIDSLQVSKWRQHLSPQFSAFVHNLQGAVLGG